MGQLAVGIIGANGRMGMMTIEAVIDDPKASIGGGLVRQNSPMVGRDIGSIVGRDPIAVAATHDIAKVFSGSDVIIDFSLPDAFTEILSMAVKTSTPIVIGTTGLTKKQEDTIKDAARTIALVYASNTSLGINLLFAIIEQISRALPTDFDIDILDFHHNKKIDAPSGTALSLGEAAAKGRDMNFYEVAKLSREGEVARRPSGEIGFAALRGGNVIGEHTVIFAGAGERLEVAHKTSGREIYAAGALRAAHWVYNQPNGLYSMRDVLGLTA